MDVAKWEKQWRFAPMTLEGRMVRLVPLAEAHAAELSGWG